MKLFFGKKRVQAENRERAKALHGKCIRYATERRGEEEYVLGRSGVISIRGEEVIVSASSKTVFRVSIRDVNVSYLLSGDGVILRGRNLEAAGAEQEITVHFVDYIK